jgi:DNA modification methylase
MDLYVYEPKVSKNERNAGCDDFQEKSGGVSNDSGRGFKTKCSVCQKEIRKDNRKNACECEQPQEYYPEVSQKNNHPTLKPISLSYRVLKLFKSPNEQKIIYPFAGVQSEVIGGYKAGFTDYVGCELSEEYVNIGNARFEYWKNKTFDKKGKSIQNKKEEKPKQQTLF